MIAPQAVSPQGDFTATGDTREGIIPRYLFGPVGSSFLYRLTGYREATLPGDLVTNKVLFFQSVLVRREVLEQVGYLDESFIAWGVDIDLSLRIRKTGRQLFISRSHKVIHEGGSALKRNDYSRVVFEHQAFAYLMKKFHGKWILVLKPLVFARHFLELFLGGIFKSGDLAYLKVRRQLLSTCLTDYR
jgi:GT2 family glycosyltransferase